MKDRCTKSEDTVHMYEKHLLYHTELFYWCSSEGDKKFRLCNPYKCNMDLVPWPRDFIQKTDKRHLYPHSVCGNLRVWHGVTREQRSDFAAFFDIGQRQRGILYAVDANGNATIETSDGRYRNLDFLLNADTIRIDCIESMKSIMRAELVDIITAADPLPRQPKTISSTTFANAGCETQHVDVSVEKEIKAEVQLTMASEERKIQEWSVDLSANLNPKIPYVGSIGVNFNYKSVWDTLQKESKAIINTTITKFKTTTRIKIPPLNVATISIVTNHVKGSTPFHSIYKVHCSASEMTKDGIMKAMMRYGFQVGDVFQEDNAVFVKETGTMGIDTGFDTRIVAHFKRMSEEDLNEAGTQAESAVSSDGAIMATRVVPNDSKGVMMASCDPPPTTLPPPSSSSSPPQPVPPPPAQPEPNLLHQVFLLFVFLILVLAFIAVVAIAFRFYAAFAGRPGQP